MCIVAYMYSSDTCTCWFFLMLEFCLIFFKNLKYFGIVVITRIQFANETMYYLLQKLIIMLFFLFLQIAVLISVAVASLIQPSFYDSIIQLKELPFLPDIKLHK